MAKHADIQRKCRISALIDESSHTKGGKNKNRAGNSIKHTLTNTLRIVMFRKSVNKIITVFPLSMLAATSLAAATIAEAKAVERDAAETKIIKEDRAELTATKTDISDVIVVTGTRQAENLLTLTGNLARINRQDIQTVHSIYPSDLLNRATGVYVQANNGMESLPSLRSPVVTGPGAGGAFLFLEDGIATRAAGFANNNGLSELNLAQAQEVDIVRGPASAIYGSNAVHGVVNVISQAVRDGGDVTLLLGPNEHYQVQGSLGNDFGAHGLSINTQLIDDGGYRDNSDFTSAKVGLRHEYSDEQDSITTSVSGFVLDQNTAGFIASGDNGEGCFESTYADERLFKDTQAMEKNCEDDAYRKWSSIRVASKWQRTLSDDRYFVLTPYVRTNDMEFRQHYLPSEAIEENSHSSIGVTSSYHWQFDPSLALVIGADAEWTSGELTETQQKASTFSFGKARQQGVHYDYEVNALTLAPYVQADWQYSHALRMSASVRFDSTHYDYENRLADGTTQADGSPCVNGNNEPVACLYQRPADSKDDFDNVSAKIGFNYLMNESVALFADWSQGFRAPQTTDLYRIQNQQVVGQIESEKMTSQEVGVRGLAHDMNFELVAFYMTKDHFFFRDDDGLNVTDAETSHKGVEVGMDYPLLSNVSIAVNYTYAIHQYESEHANSGVLKGNDVDTAPRQLGNIRLAWQPTKDSSLELEWAHVGSYYLDPSNEHEYQGHNLLQLRGQFSLSDKVRLLARLENVLDERYASRADYAFGSYRYFGGQPRAIHLGIEARF
jgi:iron complex outermembrane receptor protein